MLWQSLAGSHGRRGKDAVFAGKLTAALVRVIVKGRRITGKGFRMILSCVTYREKVGEKSKKVR